MKKFKRLLAVALAVTMVVGIVNLPTKASANEVTLKLSDASDAQNNATTLVLGAEGISGGHNFSEPSVATDGIFYNGQKVTKAWPIFSYGGTYFWMSLTDYGITNVQSGDIIKIVGQFESHDGMYNFNEASFLFNGTKWIPEVTVSISTATDAANNATTLVLGATGIPGGHNFSEPSAATDGIFYNGQKVTKAWPIFSYGGTYFWMSLADYGISNAQSGDEIKVVGQFESHDGVYSFKEKTFIFNGTQWGEEIDLNLSDAPDAQNNATTLVLKPTGLAPGFNFSEPSAATEGIFYNGQKVTKGWPILSYAGTYFWMHLPDYGITNVQTGDVIQVVGKFETVGGTRTFKESSFKFNGTQWEKYIAPTETPVTLTLATDRGDIQIFNTPDGADVITTGVYNPADAESGIFLNGTKLEDVTLYCYATAAEAGGYPHFHITQDTTGWNETTGNVLTIKGTFTKDDITLNVAEIYTKYNGSIWETHTPSNVTPVTLTLATDRGDIQIFNTPDGADVIAAGAYVPADAESGIFLNGTKLEDITLYCYATAAEAGGYPHFHITQDTTGWNETTGNVLTIKGTFTKDDINLSIAEIRTKFNGTTWSLDEGLPEVSTPTLYEPTSTAPGGFYLTSNDTVPYDENWQMIYDAKAGDDNGVWVDGQQTNVFLKKFLADRWYVCLVDRAITAQRGTVVTIKGTFVHASDEVTFNETTYIYDGQKWLSGDTLPVTTKFTITGLANSGEQSGIGMDRWVFGFNTDAEIAGESYKPLLAKVSVQVNDKKELAETYPNGEKGLGVILPFTAIPKTPAEGTTITIPTGMFGSYELTKDFVMYYANGTWNEKVDADSIQAEKITVVDYFANRDDVLALLLDKIEKLPDDATVEPAFTPANEEAKLTYNGVQTQNPKMSKYGLYLAVDVMTNGAQAKAKFGDKITLSGIWKYTGDNKFYDFGTITYRYNGGGAWEVFDPSQDVEYDMATPKIYDMFELTNLSTITMREGAQFNLADLKASTNVGMKLMVNSVPGDVIFTLSKDVANNVWVNSGYEIKLVPDVNEIRIITIEPQANGKEDEVIRARVSNMDFSKPFALEFSVADMYKKGTKELAARCIIAKVNGEEVIRWIDKDLKRTLGHYSAAWAAKETTVDSIGYEGYIPVDKNVGVTDFFDATGYAEKRVTPNECTYLGELNSKNSAVKMNVDMTKTTGEFKLAIAKKDQTTIWDIEESGYQFWFRPGTNQVFIGYGMSEYATMVSHEYSEKFVLEVGSKDVYHENGKYYGYVVYIKIDGKEVTSWLDATIKNRNMGTAIVAYGSADSDIVLSTLYNTYELPVVYNINGEEHDSSDFASVQSTVVLNKPSKITVTTKQDAGYAMKYQGTAVGEEELTALEIANAPIGVYTYEVKASKGDKIVVNLETRELTTDEPTAILDIADVMGMPSIEVESSKDAHVGSTVSADGRHRINTAVQMKLEIPENFNQIRWSMFSDQSSMWGYNGFIVKLLNNKIAICYTATERKLAEFNCDLIKPNSTLYIESGAVKCYENGNYKYDRYYVKVGETLESMELAAWFDSRERGSYGTTISAYGMDVPGSYTISSVADMQTITDASTQANKDKLATNEAFGTTNYAVYYPTSVNANSSATIKLYTKESANLKSLTVAGKNVIADVKRTDDGCYVYDIPKVTSDIKFTYVIE